MRKLSLLVLLLLALTRTQAQSFDFEKLSYEPTPLLYLYCNDTLHIESISTCYSSLKDVFHGDRMMDRTTDGIYFALHHNWYVLYVPEACTTFRVYCTQGTRYSVGSHLLYLLGEIRRNRKLLALY